jgi:Spy/CpxP family protein refolding chaperone
MSRSLVFAIGALALLSFGSVSAVASGDTKTDRLQAVGQRIAEMTERLKLTPDQVAKIRPIVESHVGKLKDLKASLGSQPTRAQKREAVGKLRDLSSDFAKQVSALLTPEQQAEWKKLRDENRERLRDFVKKKAGV